MYRQIVTPTEQDHTITLPPDLYGKQVEILAFEIGGEKTNVNKKKKFLEDIKAIPDFPSVEKIRSDAWPEKR